MNKALHILLVEDSEDDAELVKRFASQNRAKPEFLRVETEEQMRTALASGSWDLVISDYNLPTFSGLEALKILLSLDLEAPLIIVSGASEDTAIETIKAGATDYVLKSNLTRLPGAIDRAIQEAKLKRDKKITELQLFESQKMESIGRLAGGVAHDVNNVLAAITLYAEMAIEQVQSSHPLKALESLQGILKSQETAAGIIRQMLLFSRRRNGPGQIVDFGAILKASHPMISRLLGESIEILVSESPDPLPVLADRAQLEQIILNLAVNARNSMKGQGKFDLGLELQDITTFPAGLRIPLQPGKYAVLRAQDTGCGMSTAVLSRLFEPFFTTAEPGQGTGLGLSVIFGILRNAGGSVSVTSQPGRGSTFRIYWPIAKGANLIEAEIRATPRKSESTKRSQTILLVEDETQLRKIVAKTLISQGYTVLEAENGEEALGIFSSQAKKIDFLITDVIMPRMGGPELVEKIRATRPELGVLFLSGYADDSFKTDIVYGKSTSFLDKPFSTRTLIEKVAEVFKTA